MIAGGGKNRNQSNRVEGKRHNVQIAKHVAHDCFKKADRPPVLADHAQLQPALARRLPIPNPFKKRKVAGQQQEDNEDQDRDDPLGRTRQPVADIRNIRDDQKDDDQRNQRDRLNRVIDSTGNETIADRRQSEMQGHPLRRFNYQRFVRRDNRGHLTPAFETFAS